MPFNYSDEGVGYTPLPDGDYLCKVISAVPGVTKNGDDKVTVGYEVWEGEYKGKSIKNHTVTFFKDRTKKGAWMALEILKALGQPYQGAFTVEPTAWIGRVVYVSVKIEDYTREDKTTGKSNKVKWLNEFKGEQESESVPF